ncbi:MAG: YbbR-like domain-containing protein [Chlamydiales bacterium]
MTSLFNKLFVQNWQRKAISAALAVVIWFSVNHSLTTSKTIGNIPVRIVNVPTGKTVEGLQNNGLLSKRITLSLVGNKGLLDDLTSNDLEVVVDAQNKSDEWIASINKKNLISLNPEIDLAKSISRVSHQSFMIRLTKLVSEKIPVLITRPIGEPPRDYQFLDIWPYQLNLSVTGPEEIINQLKAKGVKLTFNLHHISRANLDELAAARHAGHGDVVSFYVPDNWKQIQLPSLSETPLEINDPQAQALRIDFVRSNLLPIEKPIPVSLFVPPEYAHLLKPDKLLFASNELFRMEGGLPFLVPKLCAKGVSLPFLKLVKEMLQLVIVVTPKEDGEGTLTWSIQFVCPRTLEDRYVAMIMTGSSEDEVHNLQPAIREEYLRNRFRNYMNRFQLYWPDDKRFELKVELKNETVCVDG